MWRSGYELHFDVSRCSYFGLHANFVSFVSFILRKTQFEVWHRNLKLRSPGRLFRYALYRTP